MMPDSPGCRSSLPHFKLASLRAAAPNGWRLALVVDGEERPSLDGSVRRLGPADITTWHGRQKDKNSCGESTRAKSRGTASYLWFCVFCMFIQAPWSNGRTDQ